MQFVFARLNSYLKSISLASVVKEAFFIVLFFAFVGLMFTEVLSAYVSVSRPFVNLSYFIIPFLFYRWPMIIGSIILVVMDLIFSVSMSGISAPAMLVLLRQIPYAGWFGFEVVLVVVFVVILLSVITFLVFKRVSMLSVTLAIFIVLVPCSVLRYTSSIYISNTGMPGAFIKHWLGMGGDEFTYKRMTDWQPHFSRIKDGSFLKNKIVGDDVRVISVVVESLGVPLNKSLVFFLEKKLSASLLGRFSGFSSTSFQGSTINGEIRELCSLNMDGLIALSIPDARDCIPNLLSSRGYKTYAYHNNSGRFYDRNIWYKNVGFLNFIDGTQLKMSDSYTLSHVFSGVDDRTVMGRIASDLHGESKYFAYWMTMDMHSPYSDLDVKSNGSNLLDCAQFSVSSDMECNYLKLLNNTLSVIIDLAIKVPEAKIIVSGDHMPHFFDVKNPKELKTANSHYDDKHVLSFVIYPQK